MWSIVMSDRNYFLVTSIFFAAIALVHLVRVVKGWTLSIGDADLPLTFSVMGFLVTAILSVWGFRLVRLRSLQ
jgi:hypothetical protein